MAKGSSMMAKETQVGCSGCKLQDGCQTPRMNGYGDFGLRIAIVGEAPGKTEDKRGRPFVGPSGRLLRDAFADLGISDIDKAFYLTNAIQCMIPPGVKKNKAVLSKWMKRCSERLDLQLKTLAPDLIITLGNPAANAVLKPPDKVVFTSMKVRGTAFPSQRYRCWVACCWHPSYIFDRDDTGRVCGIDLLKMEIFKDDLARALRFRGKEIPAPLVSDRKHHIVLDNFEAVLKLMTQITDAPYPVAFDFESSSLSPYAKDAAVLCVSFCFSKDTAFWLPLDYGSPPAWTSSQRLDIDKLLMDFFRSSTPKIIQNYNMEDAWSAKFFGTGVENLLNDTMVTTHIIDARDGITGLKYQVFQNYGHDYAANIDIENIDAHEKDEVIDYSCLDSRYCFDLHERQMVTLEEQPDLKMAFDFFMESIPSLSRAARVGIKVDPKILDEQERDCDEKMLQVQNIFNVSTVMKKFLKQTGKDTFNLNSYKQKSVLFYDFLKCPHPPKKTGTGAPSTDRESIDWIRDNVSNVLVQGLCGALHTYSLYRTKKDSFIKSWRKSLCDDGLFHPAMLLNIAESYRSSCREPNGQNFPKRNEEQAAIRKAIVPQLDWLCETDSSGSEIGVIAMLSHDPVLVKQIQDGLDIHRYWASRLFGLLEKDITHEQRHFAKNLFVFPLFYGSYWKSCARNLKLQERIIREIEREFWKLYEGVREWQEQLIKFYKKYGFVEMPLGFRRHGPLTVNQILNTAVQGTSYHMLQRSFNRVESDMSKEKLRSKLILQIHDSILSDLDDEEMEVYYDIVMKRMTEKQWEFQGDVPRRAEFSLGLNWKDMRVYRPKE